MVRYPILPGKTAMLFFDTLNVYYHPDDPGVRAAVARSGVLGALAAANAACREAGIAVFYAQADHRPDYRDFAPQVVDDSRYGPPGEGPYMTTAPAVTAGSRGAEVIPELAPRPADYVIRKHRWSAFYQTHLELSLRTAGIDTIMLGGGSTEVGIASTAYAARDRDFNLVILRDACFTPKEGVTEFFMAHVFPRFARVMTVAQAVATILRA